MSPRHRTIEEEQERLEQGAARMRELDQAIQLEPDEPNHQPQIQHNESVLSPDGRGECGPELAGKDATGGTVPTLGGSGIPTFPVFRCEITRPDRREAQLLLEAEHFVELRHLQRRAELLERIERAQARLQDPVPPAAPGRALKAGGGR